MHFEGPALVVAGAGSGKTRTVVHRIAYLLRERRVYPAEILAVTFTNKAAGEMKERLEKMVGRSARDLWVTTFHAAAVRILRTYGEYVGLKPGFVIYDEDDQNTLLKEVLKELELEAKPGPFRSMIDRIKNRGLAWRSICAKPPILSAACPGMWPPRFTAGTRTAYGCKEPWTSTTCCY